MTPNAPEILRGSFLTLLQPPAADGDGAFAAATVRTIGLLCLLMAEETDKAVSAIVTENRSIRALFRDAAEGGWAPNLAPRLLELARGEDQDLTLSALEASNAGLRRSLIALHERVEEGRNAAGRARERRILRLLQESAKARLLSLPGEPTA